MIHEIDIFGVFVPDILVWMITTYFISIPLRRFLGVIGLYNLVWHRSLVNFSLYLILLGATVATVERFS